MARRGTKTPAKKRAKKTGKKAATRRAARAAEPALATAAAPGLTPVTRKTSVLPVEPGPAAAAFADELTRPAVLFVVLGDGDVQRLLLERAAGLAGADTDPRWVVHAPERAVVLARLMELGNSSGKSLVGAIGCTLSAHATARIVRDIIVADEQPSMLRVFAAYVAAEV